MGLGDIELGDGGAAEGFEMGSGAETLAHFVSDGTHVGSRSHAGAEAGAVGFDGEDDEFLDLDLNRLQDYLLLFSRQLVGRDAVDFLGRERRRDLLDEALECGSELLDGREGEGDWAGLAGRGAIGVVGVGGEAEADHAFVGFFGSGVELSKTGETADDERKHAGGERIESTEMADGTLAQDVAHAVDHIVGGPAGGLIDDDDAIHVRDLVIW